MNRKNNQELITAITRELALADTFVMSGDFHLAFYHLERAHVLGQASTYQHIRIHWRMLKLAIKQCSPREIWGQMIRVIGAVTKTPFGIYPKGNTGGSNVAAGCDRRCGDDFLVAHGIFLDEDGVRTSRQRRAGDQHLVAARRYRHDLDCAVAPAVRGLERSGDEVHLRHRERRSAGAEAQRVG